MNTAVTTAPQPATDTGIDTGTIVVAGIGIVILGIIGYLVFGPKQTVAAPKAGATTAKPIPGVKAGGATNLGFLTDPNFFSGVSNLANSLAKAFSPGKTGAGSGSSAMAGDNSIISSPGDNSSAALAGADVYPQPESSEFSNTVAYSPLLTGQDS